jgi:hypothetical protein
MICEDSKMPINVKLDMKNEITNKVDLLRMDYQDSSCHIKNMCSHLLLSYDDSQRKQVVFNKKNYKLKNIKIYRPSLHKFDGIPAEGEVVLDHKGDKDTLKICIPIVTIKDIRQENKTLYQIFRHSYSKAQCEGEKITVHDITLNANSFIPKTRGFYYYKTNDEKKEGLDNINNICGETTHVVVYHKEEGYIGIKNSDKMLLDKIIKKHIHGIKEAKYKYNDTTGTIQEGFKEGMDIKSHNDGGVLMSKFIHRHDPDDVKGDKPLPNELVKAVYKGDVDELLDVLGGKRKVNRKISDIKNYKWFEKHILNYMYYMSGVIIILMYYIILGGSQQTGASEVMEQANALFKDNFDRSAAKYKPPSLFELGERLTDVETKVNNKV